MKGGYGELSFLHRSWSDSSLTLYAAVSLLICCNVQPSLFPPPLPDTINRVGIVPSSFEEERIKVSRFACSKKTQLLLRGVVVFIIIGFLFYRKHYISLRYILTKITSFRLIIFFVENSVHCCYEPPFLPPSNEGGMWGG